MAVFTGDYPIHTYETDPNGRATFAAIFRFLQDAAAAHAQRIGYGLDDMKENATLWVLSRFLYRARRTPRWQEVLRIGTWPSGTESVFALRDWTVNDERGGEVGIATSCWVVIDIEKRSPIRIERVAERMDMITDRHLFDRSAAKVPAFELGEPRYRVRASFSDMDLNNHVNATRYVEWMFEALPEGVRESGGELVEIEVNFNGESRAGDELAIFTVENSSKSTLPTDRGDNPDVTNAAIPKESSSREFLHCAVKEANGAVVCRARSLWSPGQ